MPSDTFKSELGKALKHCEEMVEAQLTGLRDQLSETKKSVQVSWVDPPLGNYLIVSTGWLLFLISYFLFLISHFSFLNSYFLFLIVFVYERQSEIGRISPAFEQRNMDRIKIYMHSKLLDMSSEHEKEVAAIKLPLSTTSLRTKRPCKLRVFLPSTSAHHQL
jgi:hypothetical protein